MGTHPIFESDFDCLTEIKKKEKSENDKEVTNCVTTQETGNVVQKSAPSPVKSVWLIDHESAQDIGGATAAATPTV